MWLGLVADKISDVVELFLKSNFCIDKLVFVGNVECLVDFESALHLKQSLIYKSLFSIHKNKLVR